MEYWLLLTVAILFEVAGTTSMKVSDGFTHPLPSVLIFLFYGISFIALTFSLKKLDIGVAYSIWSGVGTVLIVGVGVLFFGETLSLTKLFFVLIIIFGVVGLNLGSSV